MASDTNVVVLVGRLTRDPELRALASGDSVCELGLAVNSSRKVNDQWEDKPNFFNVTVFGARGETVAKYCSKGDQVNVSGRLEWQQWEKDGQKRESVKVIANSVQFLTPKGGAKSEAKSSEEAPF